MMTLLATLNNAKGMFVAITMVGGSAVTLDHLHDPAGSAEIVREQVMSEIMSDRSSRRVDTILNLVDQSRQQGQADWLCRAIDSELIQLCSEQPDHYLCKDADAKRDLKQKAGCGHQ